MLKSWLFLGEVSVDPCIGCNIAQPDATVIGFTGSAPCSVVAANPMTLVNTTAVGCLWNWRYLDDGNNNRWTLTLRENGPTLFDMELQVTNTAETFVFLVWRDNSIPRANVQCIGGELRANQFIPLLPFGSPGAGSCSGAAPSPLQVILG